MNNTKKIKGYCEKHCTTAIGWTEQKRQDCAKNHPCDGVRDIKAGEKTREELIKENDVLQEEIEGQARLLGMSGEREYVLLGKISRLEKALTKIASCKSNFPGDVVSIAQEALKG